MKIYKFDFDFDFDLGIGKPVVVDAVLDGEAQVYTVDDLCDLCDLCKEVGVNASRQPDWESAALYYDAVAVTERGAAMCQNAYYNLYGLTAGIYVLHPEMLVA